MADSLKTNADDQLIVEGYPLIDPKRKASVVLASSVKRVAQERAQRAPGVGQKGKAGGA